MKLEEKLAALRKEKGLSQLKLAEMMNVSRQACRYHICWNIRIFSDPQ